MNWFKLQMFCIILYRRLFWITGKDIVAMKLNGLAIRTCITVESEPLAVTLDVERQYLYWMTFNNENNTVELNQLAYTIEECGKRYIVIVVFLMNHGLCDGYLLTLQGCLNKLAREPLSVSI